MKRRHILSLPAVLLALRSPSFAAEEKPWLMRLVSAPATPGDWLVGLEVSMQPHWKTYWRVPGQGGVPPFVEAKGDNIKASELLCPVPTRIRTADGEAIGYLETAMLLLRITPVDAAKPMAATVSAFIGVCKDICIPAQFSAQALSTDTTSAGAAATLAKWQALLPRVSNTMITSATAILVDGKPAVRFQLAQPVLDIFVEGSDLHYFRAPMFDGNTATLTVAGAKSLDELRAKALRVTGKLAEGGLEQTVVVV